MIVTIIASSFHVTIHKTVKISVHVHNLTSTAGSILQVYKLFGECNTTDRLKIYKASGRGSQIRTSLIAWRGRDFLVKILSYFLSWNYRFYQITKSSEAVNAHGTELGDERRQFCRSSCTLTSKYYIMCKENMVSSLFWSSQFATIAASYTT